MSSPIPASTILSASLRADLFSPLLCKSLAWCSVPSSFLRGHFHFIGFRRSRNMARGLRARFYSQMPPPDPHALQGVLTPVASAAPTDASVCLQLLCVVLVPGWREGGPLGRKVQPLPSQQVQDMAHTTACLLLLPSGQIPTQPGCQGCLHCYGPLLAAHRHRTQHPFHSRLLVPQRSCHLFPHLKRDMWPPVCVLLQAPGISKWM